MSASRDFRYSHGPIFYTRDQLLVFHNTVVIRRRDLRFPPSSGGKGRHARPELSAVPGGDATDQSSLLIIMENVRSPPNKIDQLVALT